jgi:hypothetical protein
MRIPTPAARPCARRPALPTQVPNTASSVTVEMGSPMELLPLRPTVTSLAVVMGVRCVVETTACRSTLQALRPRRQLHRPLRVFRPPAAHRLP